MKRGYSGTQVIPAPPVIYYDKLFSSVWLTSSPALQKVNINVLILCFTVILILGECFVIMCFLIRFALSFICSNSSKCRPIEAVLISYSRPLCPALNAVNDNITNSRHSVQRVFVLKHASAANTGTLSNVIPAVPKLPCVGAEFTR